MEAKVIDSVLWFALEKAGDKRKDEKDRGQLEPGSRVPVSLSVEGMVDDEPVVTLIEGHLQVAHDGTAVTKTKPPAELVLALALPFIPKTKRATLLESGLAEPDPELLAIATAWVETNTTQEPKPRRGAVSFEFA
jgi:hypothetical protein